MVHTGGRDFLLTGKEHCAYRKDFAEMLGRECFREALSLVGSRIQRAASIVSSCIAGISEAADAVGHIVISVDVVFRTMSFRKDGPLYRE
ncbi:MAG: hypothetical protein ACKPKO_02650, partial [Candidatus Fonsibacter sp.]